MDKVVTFYIDKLAQTTHDLSLAMAKIDGLKTEIEELKAEIANLKKAKEDEEEGD